MDKPTTARVIGTKKASFKNNSAAKVALTAHETPNQDSRANQHEHAITIQNLNTTLTPEIGNGLVKGMGKVGLELGKMGVTASSQLIGDNSGAIRVFHNPGQV